MGLLGDRGPEPLEGSVVAAAAGWVGEWVGGGASLSPPPGAVGC